MPYRTKDPCVKKMPVEKCPESVMVHGQRLFLDRTDSLGLSKKRVYERFTTDFLSREVKKGDVIVDVGGHIGYYTLLFASLTGSSGRVHAFEPSPENFATLQKNVAVNHVQNVILNQKAVSAASGRTRLFLSEGNSGDHRICSAEEERNSVVVETVTLDEYFENIPGRVDWIKIDTQGADCAIVKGAARILHENPEIKLLTEFWPYGLRRFSTEPEDYLRLLENHGFRFFQPKKLACGFVPVTRGNILEECQTRSHLNLLCVREKTYAGMIGQCGTKKIFFAMRNSGILKNYESVLCELLEKGHAVTAAFSSFHEWYPEENIKRIFRPYPHFHFEKIDLQPEFWSFLARLLRRLQDYTRYLGPAYDHAFELKQRASCRVPWLLRFLMSWWAGQGKEERLSQMVRVFRVLETCLPVNLACRRVLHERKPDLFVVSPLVDFDSEQLDWLKAAQSLGIKTCLCVHSWDNLSNKGLIQIVPDRILLWNEIQKNEAVKFHGMSPDRVFVTGAQCFDRWFDMKPSSKEDFARRLAQDLTKPYILYLCSSSFIAPNEASFVENWIRHLRQNGSTELKSRLIVIRPHPQNLAAWRKVDFSGFANVVIYPKSGANPIDFETRRDYFDTLYYSAAVVGMNTTAMIEAAILQKPVLTVLTNDCKGGQEGTLHFNYLLDNGGLQLSRNFEVHTRQLEQMIQAKPGIVHSREFVTRFVRPHGLAKPSTPYVVEALESMFLLSRGKVRKPRRIFLLIRYALLFPMACLLKPVEVILLIKKNIRKLKS
jgi:FkbM family methyltransferase